jgi:hypothetical protein
MRSWSCKNLGDGLMAWEPLREIEERFQSAFNEAGRPKDMALFMRHLSDGRLHCEVTVYFSPASVGLALELEAKPCDKPLPEGLSLLAGDEDAWCLLLPVP